MSNFKGLIAQAHREEEDFRKTMTMVEEGRLKGFARGRMDYRDSKEEFAYPQVMTSEEGFWRRLTRVNSPHILM